MTDDQHRCFLCDRVLGEKIERHHVIPRLKGGRETVLVHPICHRTIHATFTEAELARTFHTQDALRSHPDIKRFIEWVAKRPPDFHSRTAVPAKSRSRRR